MRPSLPIYLDNHATTPVDPRVLDTMFPYFTRDFGNAASRQHEFGWRAEAAVKKARRQVALLIGADPDEILFTSGATESVNLALKGIAEAYQGKGRHVVTVSTEHRSTLDTCSQLENAGFDVTYLGVDAKGQLPTDDFLRSLRPETILVSVMAANNEIGTITDIEPIGEICRARNIFLHTDAAQAAGKIIVDVRRMNVDLLSFTSHKMYGPKGTGALYVRKRSPAISLVPQINGGGHEKGLRSGTLNVPGIVGFGAATEIALGELHEEAERVRGLRQHLVDAISAGLEDVFMNGDAVHRLPGNVSLRFSGVHADQIISGLREVACSTGSACSSGSSSASHVLKAIGLNDEEARSTIRFGIGRFNTTEEIDFVSEGIIRTVHQAREKALTRELRYS